MEELEAEHLILCETSGYRRKSSRRAHLTATPPWTSPAVRVNRATEPQLEALMSAMTMILQSNLLEGRGFSMILHQWILLR